MMSGEKSFAADVDGVEVGPKGVAARNAEFIGRRDGQRFPGLGCTAREPEVQAVFSR